MVRAPRALAVAAVGVIAVLGCDKKNPPVPAVDAEGPAAPIGLAAPLDAGVDAATPDAGPGYPPPAAWSTARLRGTRLDVRYPSEIFLMDEEKDGAILLTSQLTVAPLPEDAGPASTAAPSYAFRARFAVRKVGLVEAASLEHVGSMFPGGKRDAFVPADGRAERRSVAKHAAYTQRLFAHGFDALVVLVELGPKRTLAARFDLVGDALKARVDPSAHRPLAWQLELADLVLASLTEGP